MCSPGCVVCGAVLGGFQRASRVVLGVCLGLFSRGLGKSMHEGSESKTMSDSFRLSASRIRTCLPERRHLGWCRSITHNKSEETNRGRNNDDCRFAASRFPNDPMAPEREMQGWLELKTAHSKCSVCGLSLAFQVGSPMGQAGLLKGSRSRGISSSEGDGFGAIEVGNGMALRGFLLLEKGCLQKGWKNQYTVAPRANKPSSNRDLTA